MNSNDIEETASLSDFWRRRKSSKDYEELASIQRAAQGFISFISGEEYSVSWTAGNASMSFQHKEIQLNYAPVADKDAPFSGEDIDIIIGDAVHEAGHVKFSYPKQKLEKAAVRKLGYSSYGYGRNKMQPINHVANIIEDFYIENRISEEYRVRGGDSAIFGYLKAAKADAAKSPMPSWVSKELLTPDPSLEAILAAWGRFVLVGDWSPPKNSSPEAAKIFEQLVDITIKSPKAKIDSKRIRLALDAYELISGLRHQNEPHAQSPSQSEVDDSVDGENQSQKTGQTESDQEKTGRGVTGEYKEKEESSEESSGVSKKEVEKEEGGNGGGKEEEDKEEESEREQPQGISPEEKPEDEAKNEPEPEEDFGPDAPDTTDLKEIESMYSLDATEKQAPPRELQEAIEDFLAHGAEDISSDVDNYLGGGGGDRVKMSMAKLDQKKAVTYEREAREIARRVAMLFEWDKKLRTRYRRGLYEGKVSKSRLARAGASDYRLFHKKEILAAPSLAVALLIDASGSMTMRWGGQSELDKALKTATALKLAFQQRENIDVMVCAYSGPYPYYGPTDIFRIYDKASNGLRLDVGGGGGTPSGQAIASIATQMNRFIRGKDRLIIHITDGSPDDHEKVAKAVENCRKHNIEVMTLSTYQLSDEVINSYQGLVVKINGMKDLETAIPALLEKRIKRRAAKV